LHDIRNEKIIVIQILNGNSHLLPTHSLLCIAGQVDIHLRGR